MKGTIVSIAPIGPPGSKLVTLTEIDGPPTLDALKAAIGGGYLEVVPGFTSFDFRSKRVRCVAFCDEDGKNKQLPINRPATMLWHHALKRNGHPGLRIAGTDDAADVLCGDIAILFGDDEFMESL